MDTPIRFVALYFATLFSLDTYTAAANSPYRTSRNTVIPPRRSDYGEGSRVGFRLDPGGPENRRGGFGGGGIDVNVPSCGACAAPKIS